MKKLVTILLAVCMLISLAACGSQPAETSAAPAATEAATTAAATTAAPAQTQAAETTTAAETEPAVPQWKVDHPTWLCEEKANITVTTYDGASSVYLPPSNDLYFWQWMEEMTNVHVEFDVIPYASYDEIATARLAAGEDLSDIIITTKSGTALQDLKASLGENEVIVNVGDYWDTCCQNIEKYFSDPETSQENYKVRITAPTGEIWGLSGLAESRIGRITALWNKTWMDELGLEVPETLDEFHDVLVAFKNAGDINKDGLENEIPLTTVGGSYLVGYLGSPYGLHQYENMSRTNMWEDGDGKLYDERLTDKMKDTLTYINSLYAEGLLDPEFSSGSDHVTELLASARCGCVIYYSTMSRAYGRMINQFYDPDVVTTNQGVYMGLGLKSDANGNQSTFLSDSSLSSTTALFKNGENAEIAIRWMDFLLCSEEALTERSLGPVGIGYNIDANGEYEVLVTEEGIRPVITEYGCGQIAFPLIQTKLQLLAGNMIPATQWYVDALLNIDSNSTFYKTKVSDIPFTEEEQEVLTTWETDYGTYWEEMRDKFISGDTDINAKWDEYIENMNALGAEEILGAYQSKYDRLK